MRLLSGHDTPDLALMNGGEPMAKHEPEEWFRRGALPGLDTEGRWNAMQLGAGKPGRRAGILLTLKEGTLPEFLSLWDAYAQAVLKEGGLPEPNHVRQVPVSDKELVNAIEPPASFLTPDDDDKRYGQVPPEEQAHFLIVGRGFFGLLISEIKVEGLIDPRERIASISVGSDLPQGAVGTLSEPVATPAPGPGAPDAVITAVIDGGLPLAHARFRKGLTDSRIEYAWIMDAQNPGPSFVGNGVEYNKGQIDGMLAASLINGQVDEDLFYRLSGQASYDGTAHNELGYAVTHGAHVMDIAAGRDWSDPMAQTNPIIAVQLPNPVTADTSGASLEGYVEAALKWIRKRAAFIAASRGTGPLPLVVNFSYGFIAGPHNGKGVLEVAMEKFIQTRPGETAVCLPSGNRFLSACHCELTKDYLAAGGNTRTLTWRLQPDDQTESFVEFWMPATNSVPATPRISMTVEPPGGPKSKVVTEIDGDHWVWQPMGPAGQVVAEIAYYYMGPPIRKGVFSISVQRTRSFDQSLELAPSGDWKIEVTMDPAAFGDTDVVNGWIQRDDTIYADHARGRQSYFREASYNVFNPPGVTPEGDWSQTDHPDCPIKKNGLMSAIATGSETFAFGGLMMKDGQTALYSAGGPTDNPGRPAPNALAESDTSRVHGGTIAAASRSGAVATLGGTSVSCPRMARKIAEAMLAGTVVTDAVIAGWAAADEATVFNNRPPPPPPMRSQHGRIEAPTGRGIVRIDFP